MAEYTAGQLQALRLLSDATHGTGFANDLTGDRHRKVRGAILLALTGEKVPVAKAGVNAVVAALNTSFAIVGDCPAARERELSRLCRQALTALQGKES